MDDDNGRQRDPPPSTSGSKSIPPRRLSNSTSALDSTTGPSVVPQQHYGSLNDYHSIGRPSSPVVMNAAAAAGAVAAAGILHSRDSSTDSIQWRAANGSGVFDLLSAAERDTEIKRLVFTAINDGNRPMLVDFLATYPSATEVLQLLLTTTYPNSDLFYQLDEEVVNDAAELLGPSMAHLNAIQIACVLNEEDIALDLLDFVARVTEEIESRKVLYEFMGRVWGNGNTVLHLASFQGMSALVKRLLELGAAGKKRNDRNYRPVDCADDQVTTAMFSLVVDEQHGEMGVVEAQAREAEAAEARLDRMQVEDGSLAATALDSTSDPPFRDRKAVNSNAAHGGDQRVTEEEDGVMSIPPADDALSSTDNVQLHGEPRNPTSKTSTVITSPPATAASPAPPLDLTTPIKLLARQLRKSSLSNTSNPTTDGKPPPQPGTKKHVAFSPDTLLLNLCQHGAQTGDPQYMSSITTCLDILAAQNIDINSVRTPQKALTPLHQACTYGHADITRLLLLRDGSPLERIRVNVYDSEGWTPLHCACAEGHVECVKLLGRCRGEDERTKEGDQDDQSGGFFYPLDGPVDLVARNGDGETPEEIVLEDRADEIIAVLTDLKTRYPPPERTEPDGYDLSETGFGDSQSLDSLASISADVRDDADADHDMPDADVPIDVDDKDRLNTKRPPLLLPWRGAANAGFGTAGSDEKLVGVESRQLKAGAAIPPDEAPTAAVLTVPPLQDDVDSKVFALAEKEFLHEISPEAGPCQTAYALTSDGGSSSGAAEGLIPETAAQLSSRIASISEEAAADEHDETIPPPARDSDRIKENSLQQPQTAAASSPERRRRVVRPASSRDPPTDEQPPLATLIPQSPTRIPALPLSLSSSPSRLSFEPSPPITPLHCTTGSLIPVSSVSRSRGGSEADLSVDGGAQTSEDVFATATQVMQSPDSKTISPTPPPTLPIRLPTGRRKDPPPKLRVAVGGGVPTGGAASAEGVATPTTPRQTPDGGAANNITTNSYSLPRPPSSMESSPADGVRPKLSRRGSLSVQTVVRGSPSSSSTTTTHEPRPLQPSISSQSPLAPQSPAGSSTNAVPTTPTTRSRLSRRFSITRTESVAVDVPFILRSDLAQQSSTTPSPLQQQPPLQQQRQEPPIHRLYPIRPAGGSSSPYSSSLLSSSTPAPPTCTLVRTSTLSAPFASGRTKLKQYHYATTTVLPPPPPPPPQAAPPISQSAAGPLASPIPRAPPQPMWKRQSASPRNTNNNSSSAAAAGSGGLQRPPPASEPFYAPDVPAGLVRKGSVRERAAAINSATAR
ncbi:hypothetical protein HDU87_004202 [Geranomyces variabilis]|uniref:Ankyrin repeat protein n=1 Tax=Geranomyces variabilis TaxID=109894 RepID=A0AAD5TJ17_9FUNG|nr:hypothetical protein HDU87_004202 [Geranomyces variabilis]